MLAKFYMFVEYTEDPFGKQSSILHFFYKILNDFIRTLFIHSFITQCLIISFEYHVSSIDDVTIVFPLYINI